MLKRRTALIVLIPVLTFAAGALVAAPSESPTPKADSGDLFTKGMDAIRAKDYSAALALFAKADKASPDDPEIINMLAYSTRKTGKLEDARTLYLRALALRPKFPEAREYLGECYLELANEQLRALGGYGEAGRESRDQLAAAIKAFAEGVAAGNDAKLPERSW